MFVLNKFGKFIMKTRGVRVGRNPQTGERMTFPPRIVARFKMSGDLVKLIAAGKKVE